MSLFKSCSLVLKYVYRQAFESEILRCAMAGSVLEKGIAGKYTAI